MSKSKKTPEFPSAFAPEITAAMAAINPVGMKVWLDILSQSNAFVSDRLKQDMDVQQAFLACKTPADLVRVQTEFMKGALEQYVDQATRTIGVMTSGAKDVSQDLKTGHRRSYDDIPL